MTITLWLDSKYFDLRSDMVKLVKKIDNFYDPDLLNEITVSKKTVNLETYQKGAEMV